MSKQAIESPRAPKPVGPYSQAVAWRDLIFVSGQIPADAAGKMEAVGAAAQTEICLKNIAVILESAGLGLENVLKTTVFMIDLSQFAAMNEIYSRFFKPPFPARATVQVSMLPRGAAVEIEAVAGRE
ncbi:MAG: Rid family detoxifying hydrolase [Elusimicrobiota bacterium]